MGFSRQEYWSGLLFPSPGDLPDPGIKPGSPALQADSLPLSHQGSPQKVYAEQNVVSAPSVKGKGDTPPSNHNIINNIEGRGNLGYDHCSFCLEGTGWGPSSWMPRDEPQYLRVNVLPRASLSRTVFTDQEAVSCGCSQGWKGMRFSQASPNPPLRH